MATLDALLTTYKNANGNAKTAALADLLTAMVSSINNLSGVAQDHQAIFATQATWNIAFMEKVIALKETLRGVVKRSDLASRKPGVYR